jgi:hypothetical protein
MKTDSTRTAAMTWALPSENIVKKKSYKIFYNDRLSDNNQTWVTAAFVEYYCIWYNA